MIGIIDYGMGNLFSVSSALQRLEVPYLISDSIEELQQVDGLILPGVGAFPDAMKRLKELGLDGFITDRVKEGTPLLGICLGMQLLFEHSKENEESKGLGLLQGSVERIPQMELQGEILKVPHMGWNRLDFQQLSPLTINVQEDYVYFVHSFYVNGMKKEDLIASATYGVRVPAVVGRENVMGMQFHPEKSGKLGIQLLQNFTTIAQKGLR
ncbi:imidazole glycerol phosphate synthase [Bacillus coahuilensis m2-6]|uniref:Imidazole glycerol phosphate synthase subunit HisH n=1 Tax=Bacillus coahuilensis p1.1.43 TaxID=1150625 RepID=A0A147K5T9_9BACI|nr:imidazole glycerol phosphate synthase subunit HisH [Bacillus coahuilensis]KUP05206.1 imidazole glycerol phosphate synthase [Bacillus coahuilensis p1.1.43]KUP05657.1 imidazole glycerol phosphate synthase [Bacillus coahuilensis m2-6]